MRIFILLVALTYCTSTNAGQFEEPAQNQSPEMAKIGDRRASFLRAQIRARRLEISFVEERIARTRRELRLELRDLTNDPDSPHCRELEQEVREIFAQREARLGARIGALGKELERLEKRLAKS